MREVRLIATSDDGTHLILSGDDDERLALRIDESLHAAIRGDRARLGQLEIQLENQLRPKDIQTRIRAGESVESVAAVAGMALEKVRRFAGPVLAEREHIADRARQATIRRVHADGPPRVLGDAASLAAASAGADPEGIEWDAWRRDDGRWQVRCSWQAPEAEATTTALFSFDPSGRSVLADDDSARTVAGDVRTEPAEPEQPAMQPAAHSAGEATGRAAGPIPAEPVDDPVEQFIDTSAEDVSAETVPTEPVRLTVVPDVVPDAPDYPIADDELQATMPQGLVSLDEPAAPATTEERRNRRSSRSRNQHRRRDTGAWGADGSPRNATGRTTQASPAAGAAWSGQTTPADQPHLPERPAAATLPTAAGADGDPAAESAGFQTTDTSATDTPDTSAGEAQTGERLRLADIASHVEDEPVVEPDPAPARPAKKSGSKSRRPSVPTWDEIMFGRRKSD